ncbi:cell division protein ZapE [Thalassotalea sp. 1_MG-2023]|uniref:cell division protein ZapE n=1 Tax=Thalassotalea sp. 1_MG-2023 TaxID=3062680 RepID=UPI0026E14321|nr:cell division protein ZapE [Thalassotalea sp. 1_MG-2023]MDO6427377.1 cell division protein ZapE [Thalassotalea sp. 1_MG-2023]
MLDNSPIKQYNALMNQNKIYADPAQSQAISLLQQLYETIQKTPHKRGLLKSIAEVKGLYLWGKVGRGKTFLMDLFVQSLPAEICTRHHFHHFMQDVHHQLKLLTGKPEPLTLIAKQYSQQYRVLCFDEFFVSDIGDAMLLGRLMKAMFDFGIVIVTTSNCAPDQLYRNGLQRERFLPAIAAIKHYTKIVHLDGKQDHRHRTLTFQKIYFQLPHDVKQQHKLHQHLLSEYNLIFSMSASSIGAENLPNEIVILGRNIPFIASSTNENNRSICFDFSQLCQGPRSHFDYVELAKQFDTILLLNIPPLSGQPYERIKARGTEDNGLVMDNSASKTGEREIRLAPMDDAARRFIAFIDECYDRQLNVVLTSYVEQSELYNSGTLMFEFERTNSRLIEMASEEYQRL